jgi:hypothetical protein
LHLKREDNELLKKSKLELFTEDDKEITFDKSARKANAED